MYSQAPELLKTSIGLVALAFALSAALSPTTSLMLGVDEIESNPLLLPTWTKELANDMLVPCTYAPVEPDLNPKVFCFPPI